MRIGEGILAIVWAILFGFDALKAVASFYCNPTAMK